MSMFTLLGLIAALTGCIGLYLSSGNQRWLPSPLPAVPARMAATLLMGVGWLGLAHEMHALTVSFVFITVLMLAFTLLPYVGALLGILRRQ